MLLTENNIRVHTTVLIKSFSVGQPWLKLCMLYDTSFNCLRWVETLCAAINTRVYSRCVERYCSVVVFVVFVFHLTPRWLWSASTPSDITSCSISWVASGRCTVVRSEQLSNSPLLSKEIILSPVSVCLSVCLLIGLLKTKDSILMKYCGIVGHNPGTNRLDFVSNPDLGHGVWQQSQHLDTCPWGPLACV